ncbi:YoaK family protein [Williamsia sp. SKLECPSW1]
MRLLRRDELLLATALSALGGFVDAVGYILLGGYFLSFMSGNTTRLAVGVTQPSGAVVVQTGTLLAAFFAGVLVGAATVRLVPARPAVLVVVTAALGCGALVVQWGFRPAGVAIVAAAMGAMNSVFQRDGEVAVGLTYMTGTLVKAGQRLVDALSGGPRWLWLRYLSMWAALAGGAVTGAFAYRGMGTGALWLAAASAGVLTAVTPLFERRQRLRVMLPRVSAPGPAPGSESHR